VAVAVPVRAVRVVAEAKILAAREPEETLAPRRPRRNWTQKWRITLEEVAPLQLRPLLPRMLLNPPLLLPQQLKPMISI
jgi:hypothetical protein